MKALREVNASNKTFWSAVIYDSAGHPTAPTPAPLKIRKPGAGWWMRAIPATTTNEQSQFTNEETPR